MRADRPAAVANAVAFLSIVLFGLALASPAFDEGSGLAVLAFGWLGLIAAGDAPANLAWLANPLFVAALFAIRGRFRRAAIWPAAVALALTVLPALLREAAVDESGVPRAIRAFHFGYDAWVGAMVCVLAAALLTPAPPPAASAAPRSPPGPRP